MSSKDKRIVLVTGGTRGIGAAIVQQFLSEGAEVYYTGTSPGGAAGSGANLHFWPAEFTNPDSLDALLHRIEALERLDVCVNNAGINIIKPVYDVTVEDFDRLTSIDFRAPYLISQAAARVMRKAGRGWIINIASIWAVVTKKGRTPYVSSKTGLVGMTRAFATDLAADGIVVNCVSPGFVMTDLTRQSLSDAEMQALAAQVPAGRFAQPEEIARYVSFLGGEQNTYMTGQNLVVDGGFTHV